MLRQCVRVLCRGQSNVLKSSPLNLNSFQRPSFSASSALWYATSKKKSGGGKKKSGDKTIKVASSGLDKPKEKALSGDLMQPDDEETLIPETWIGFTDESARLVHRMMSEPHLETVCCGCVDVRSKTWFDQVAAMLNKQIKIGYEIENLPAMQLLRIMMNGVWYVIRGVEDDVIFAFSSVEKAKEFNDDLDENNCTPTPGLDLFTMIALSDKLVSKVILDPEADEDYEDTFHEESLALAVYVATTLKFEAALLQINPNAKSIDELVLNNAGAESMGRSVAEHLLQRDYVVIAGQSGESEDKFGLLSDEQNRVVIATALDHIAEFAGGDLKPVNLSFSELFDMVREEGMGLSFTIGANTKDPEAGVEHQTVTWESNQTKQILELVASLMDDAEQTQEIDGDTEEPLEK